MDAKIGLLSHRFVPFLIGVAMGLVVPKVRKHLCADALFGSVRTVFDDIVDHRKGDPDIALSDALMSAFAMFSLKSPSLLAFDKVRAEDNLQSIYGIGRAPCDTSMRELLDPVNPERLRPAFKAVFRQFQRGKALEEMVFVEGHYLLALDGTGYFSSKEIHCESCLEHHHRNGTVTYSHQMLGAALVHPDKREVIPLRAIVKSGVRLFLGDFPTLINLFLCHSITELHAAHHIG